MSNNQPPRKVHCASCMRGRTTTASNPWCSRCNKPMTAKEPAAAALVLPGDKRFVLPRSTVAEAFREGR